MLPVKRPSKRFGQHFLQDRNLARKIVESMKIQKGDVLLEIGPGRGELTERLLESSAERIVAIEIDPALIQILSERFGDEKRFQPVHADFLTIEISKWVNNNKKIRVIGNLPYNITSPILFRLLNDRSLIEDMTVMVQKEVGDRLTSPPGVKKYGIPSVLFQVFCRIKTILFIPRTAFYPVPKVDSSVLRFQFLNPVPFDIQNLQFFEDVVKTTFGQRRKMLKNTLKHLVINEELLKTVSIDLHRRPESLSVDQFVQLANELQ
jgi:16S rRNA (adenine1518-N6/adenine1519-N6)-dimethyltransferase